MKVTNTSCLKSVNSQLFPRTTGLLMLSKQRWELTTVTALRAVNESLWLALLVGLLTLLAYATKIIGSDLTLQGQNNAIKNMATKPRALHDTYSNTHFFFPPFSTIHFPDLFRSTKTTDKL